MMISEGNVGKSIRRLGLTFLNMIYVFIFSVPSLPLPPFSSIRFPLCSRPDRSQRQRERERESIERERERGREGDRKTGAKGERD
jgi:hypothetical protein